MADIDTTLMEQVSDVAQLRGKPDVKHDRQTADLAARLEVAKMAAIPPQAGFFLSVHCGLTSVSFVVSVSVQAKAADLPPRPPHR